jgi:hypothetical protein
MFLIYKPDGQDEKRYVYNPGKLRVSESEAIEDRTGLAYGGDFKIALLKGNMRARRALLWTYLRREHPAIRYEDVDFADDEVSLEMDKDEINAELEALPNASISDDDKRMAEMVYREQLKTAPDAPAPKGLKSVEKSTA